jgi:integrase
MVAPEDQLARKRLTDRTLKALPAAKPGARYDLMDTDVPGLGVRVNDKGLKTFVLLTRYPGSANPTRRAVGEYGTKMTLEKAREKARHWQELIRRGTDPKDEEERLRRAEGERRENSFAKVAGDFERLALVGRDPKNPLQRTGLATARDIQKEFVSRFGGRPIDSITSKDIVSVLDAAVARGAAFYAHKLLADVRRLFNWAIARGAYGIEQSPCDRMRPAKVIGSKEARNRVLGDDELRGLWGAAGVMGYPFGALIQLLVLTGQRKSEVAEARWSEFELPSKLWRIPAARMKANATHVIPLPGDAMRILESLPRFNSGDFLFSTTFGEKPVSGFSKAKLRLDALMAAQLQRPVQPFVLHDIRRTMRTGLSALPIPDLVRELVIAHSKPGLHKVYDQHAYLNEKRQALELWQARVREIVSGPTQRPRS